MKTSKIIRSKETINHYQRQSSIKIKPPNSLEVGKEITLGSSSRGLGYRIEILLGGPFPFTCKRKSKGGLLQPQQTLGE
jgi:hypothetical protein